MDELPEEFINELFRRQFGGEEGQTPAEIMTDRVAELHEMDRRQRAYDSARIRARNTALGALPLYVLPVGAFWRKKRGLDEAKKWTKADTLAVIPFAVSAFIVYFVLYGIFYHLWAAPFSM